MLILCTAGANQLGVYKWPRSVVGLNQGRDANNREKSSKAGCGKVDFSYVSDGLIRLLPD